jgi:protein involved in polysaccharide export with SLBB domain
MLSLPVMAQLPNDLKSVKVDELSDDQIQKYIQESEVSGIPEQEQEQIALRKGMPPAELQKLKERVAILRGKPTSNVSIAKPKNIDERPSEDTNIVINNSSVAKAPTVQVEKNDPEEIYGHQLFKNNNLQFFEKASDVRAPDDYILGTNDELTISVFGFSYFNESLKIDSRGAINAGSGIGPIRVKGLTFAKARDLIRSRFGQYFDLSNNQLTITLSYSRVINVNFVGDVVRPGSYKIPALNTAFNALIVVGGPSDLGSVRNIQIKRNGKLIKTLDVYEYVTKPNSKMDFYLEDNDYIFITAAEKIVKVSGQVKRPMRFELKGKEGLEELLNYAGGLTALAYTKLIRVSRSSADGKQQLLLNISLDSLRENKKSFELFDGDQIEIGSKSTELVEYVEIQGSVNLPGKFEFVEGQRVSDLVKMANGTRYESLLERAYLIRLKPDLTKEYISINVKEAVANPKSEADILLKKGDMVRIASNRDFTDELKVDAIGAFRKPNKIEFTEGMTLGDLLFVAGGLKMEADILHIEVSRISFFTDDFKPGDDSRIIIKVLEVGRDLKITDDQLSFKLRPFDQVFARVVPDFEYQQNFSITGEVKYPGVYTLETKDEKLASIVKRAGGLNRFAFPEAATLYRPGLAGGYIVMNLPEALKSEKSKYNYIVKAGDVINIPKVIDLIAIRGDVEYLQVVDQEQVNAPFVKGKRANYYIKDFANGFTKTTHKKKTYVIDNNGKVNRTKNFLGIKLYPKVKKGSVIYAVTKPEKVKRDKKKSEPIDWNKAIADVTIKITGLLTLVILIRTVAN